MTSPPDGDKQARSKEQTSADLLACHGEANAVIERNAKIDQDTNAASENLVVTDSRYEMPPIADDYSRKQRYFEIVNECMRSQGYALSERSPFE